jgi:hypothetical protein
MENEDSSPDLQLVGQIKDHVFTTSMQVNPQEIPRKKREHPEREMPPFPFLYQG